MTDLEKQVWRAYNHCCAQAIRDFKDGDIDIIPEEEWMMFNYILGAAESWYFNDDFSVDFNKRNKLRIKRSLYKKELERIWGKGIFFPKIKKLMKW